VPLNLLLDKATRREDHIQRLALWTEGVL